MVSRRSGTRRSTSSSGTSSSSSSWTERSSRAPKPSAASRSATRIIAIFTMSAAVPWMGMLIAIRSPAPRSAGFAACSSGIWRFRPSSVATWPCRRAVSLMWSM